MKPEKKVVKEGRISSREEEEGEQQRQKTKGRKTTRRNTMISSLHESDAPSSEDEIEGLQSKKSPGKKTEASPLKVDRGGDDSRSRRHTLKTVKGEGHKQ